MIRMKPVNGNSRTVHSAFGTSFYDLNHRYGVLGIANLAVSRDTHQELFDVGKTIINNAIYQ